MDILLYPHPALRYKSKPVQKINKELRHIVAELFEAMYRCDGVGLAANQVGIPIQLFVMNVTGDATKPEGEFVFINPVIQRRKGNEEDEEGCLSFPDIRTQVIRSATIEFEGISLSGKTQSFEWNGMLARAAQHEIDHIHGMSFIDRLSPTAFADIREDLLALESVFARRQHHQLALNLIPNLAPSDAEWAEQAREIEQRFC